MSRALLVFWVWAVNPALAQTPLPERHFTPAQQTEWTQFMAHWHGNGKGTCMPMMEAPIRKGLCTRFDFSANLTIGKDGRVKAVQVLRNQIVCKDPAVRSELLKCFTQALRDDAGLWRDGGFSSLRGRTLSSVAL